MIQENNLSLFIYFNHFYSSISIIFTHSLTFSFSLPPFTSLSSPSPPFPYVGCYHFLSLPASLIIIILPSSLPSFRLSLILSFPVSLPLSLFWVNCTSATYPVLPTLCGRNPLAVVGADRQGAEADTHARLRQRDPRKREGNIGPWKTRIKKENT